MGVQTIDDFIENEADFVECLAFTRLHDDVINFTLKHLDDI